MGFITTIRIALTHSNTGLSKGSPLRSLKEKNGLEQEEFNTCLNCYRDYAYEMVSEVQHQSFDLKASSYPEQARSKTAHTIYACKYCGIPKVVSRIN